MDMKVKESRNGQGLPFQLQAQEGRFPELTPNEWQVFCYVVHGFRDREIAPALSMTRGQVDRCRSTIQDKLGDHDMLVRLGIAKGIVALPVGEELAELRDRYSILNATERTMMRLIAEGTDPAAISEALNISSDAVDIGRTSIMHQLNTYSLTGLIRAQLALGTIEKNMPVNDKTKPSSFAERIGPRNGWVRQ